jgi:hypothetical protein
MQCNATSTYERISESGQLASPEKRLHGFVTIPSCDLLVADIRKRNSLVIPRGKENISILLRETLEDIVKFAPQVSSHWNGRTVTIIFHNYPFIQGCKAIARKAPRCCTKTPCPTCSLCGVLIAEGLDMVISFDQCSFNASSHDVTARFSIVPSLDRNP